MTMTATLSTVLATSTVPVCGDASGTLPSPSPAGTPREFDASRSYFPAPRVRPSTRPAADALTMCEAVGLAAGVGA